MDELAAYIVTFALGTGFTAVFAWLRFRKRDHADTAKIAADTAQINVSTEKLAAEAEQVNIANRKAEAEYLRESNESILAQMEKMQLAMKADRESAAIDKAAATAEIASIKAAQEEGLRRYEQRAGSLVAEIKTLSSKLETANATIQSLQETIKENNITIVGLQQQVQSGNEKIASLQNVITDLNKKINNLMERLLDNKEK